MDPYILLGIDGREMHRELLQTHTHTHKGTTPQLLGGRVTCQFFKGFTPTPYKKKMIWKKFKDTKLLLLWRLPAEPEPGTEEKATVHETWEAERLLAPSCDTFVGRTPAG